MQNFQTAIFNAVQSSNIARRSLGGLCADASMKATTSVTPDGSKFFTNEDGKLIYAEFANGSAVKKYDSHTAVRTTDGDFWMGTKQGGWFRFD